MGEEFSKMVMKLNEMNEELVSGKSLDETELRMRIKSHAYAMKMVCDEIEDGTKRETARRILDGISKGNLINKEKSTEKNKENKDSKENKQSSMINDEILRSSVKLRELAVEFSEAVKRDKKIVDSVTTGFSKGAVGNKENIENLSKTDSGVSNSTFLLLAIFSFVLMYFVIRFL